MINSPRSFIRILIPFHSSFSPSRDSLPPASRRQRLRAFQTLTPSSESVPLARQSRKLATGFVVGAWDIRTSAMLSSWPFSVPFCEGYSIALVFLRIGDCACEGDAARRVMAPEEEKKERRIFVADVGAGCLEEVLDGFGVFESFSCLVRLRSTFSESELFRRSFFSLPSRRERLIGDFGESGESSGEGGRPWRWVISLLIPPVKPECIEGTSVITTSFVWIFDMSRSSGCPLFLLADFFWFVESVDRFRV